MPYGVWGSGTLAMRCAFSIMCGSSIALSSRLVICSRFIANRLCTEAMMKSNVARSSWGGQLELDDRAIATLRHP